MLYSELRGNLSGILDGIITGSRRIEQIIKHLKEYARQGAVESTQDVDANQVIQSTLTLLAPQIRKATHALRIELEDDLPPVRGNFGRLEQVLVNLVQNACQALPDPGKELVIRSAYHPSDGTVEIVVQDEGIGIPSEILENVRAPFVTTKREQGGLGLGLSIASTIVDEHNGRLDLVSKIGQGTRAIVQLPISHGR
jgi:polar amino acid transport system substrate-binding protein